MFVRGLLATYATLGILGYGAILVNNAVNTSATAISIQRSLVTLSNARGVYTFVFSDSTNLWPRTFLVSFSRDICSESCQKYNIHVICNQVLADYGGEFNNLNITSRLDDPVEEHFTAECQQTPNSAMYGQNCTLEAGFNVDTLQLNVTSNVSLSIWMIEATTSAVEDIVDLSQFKSVIDFTTAFKLYPDTHLLATLYPTQRVQGTNSWLTFAVRA